MFDVKHEWQKSVMKLMQIILEKVCRKNIKINISDERKERNAHVKENWTENAGKKQLVTRSILKLLRDKAKGTWQGRKQLFKASVFWMNHAEFTGTWRSLRMTARQNSAAVTDVTLNSTHRKGYQSKLLFFHSKGGRWIFWGLLYCDDRRSPWWTSRDGLQHDHIRSDTAMIRMNFNSYASLVIFFIISVFFCFVFEHWTLYTIWVLTVFDFNFRTEACNLKLGMSNLFSFEDFCICSHFNNVNYGA